MNQTTLTPARVKGKGKGREPLPLIDGKRVRGAVIYTGPGFDGRRVVVIATFRTSNRKTGPMAQVWILRASGTPLTAITEGRDATICGTCPHRSRASGGAGTCYVNVAQAPQAVHRTWKAGRYHTWDGTDAQLAALLSGRAVRFGAYGDPALIPADLIARIVPLVRKHTGYTHAWATSPAHAAHLMASVDSVRERDNARSHGWRTFRVAGMTAGETAGPALADGGRRERHRGACPRAGLWGWTSSLWTTNHGHERGNDHDDRDRDQ